LRNSAAGMTVNASPRTSGEALRVAAFSRKAACLLPLLALASIGQAQTELMGTRLGEQVQTTLTDPAFQQGGWDAFRLAPPRMSPSWSSGDFSVQLAAVAQVFYDDNILQDNLDRLGDMRFSLDPSVHLRWDPSTAPAGTGVEVFFAPQLEWFDRYSQFNTVNYYGGADLAAFFGRTSGILHYRTALSSEPEMLQTARNQQHTENVSFEGTHELGGKTRLSSQFELGYGDISGGSQYWEFGGRLLLEYHLRERLALGAGYGLRYVDTQPGFGMLFNEPQAELLWAYTDRLHITLRAGVEIGMVEGSAAAGTQMGPLVAGSLSYAATEKTDLRLELSRQSQPSYYSTAQLDDLTRGAMRFGRSAVLLAMCSLRTWMLPSLIVTSNEPATWTRRPLTATLEESASPIVSNGINGNYSHEKEQHVVSDIRPLPAGAAACRRAAADKPGCRRRPSPQPAWVGACRGLDADEPRPLCHRGVGEHE
jgi:hypothetical protein